MVDVTFVVLGATGDLTKRKLIPAISNLMKRKVNKILLVGCSRTKTTMKQVIKESKKFGKVDSKLTKRSYYQKLDFYDEKDYAKLNQTLSAVERKHKISGHRIFYLATLPKHFDVITKNLAKYKVAKSNSKVVYEKPFGQDFKSAKKINKCIHSLFKEKQVYRIDHYLGKELVGNIALMRFTNRVLEPLWNRHHIEAIRINMSETITVDGRGKFYDKYGALKDVVQNHALQLLALTAMEPPRELTGEYVRNEKSKVLSKTKIDDLMLGQYSGYTRTKGVKSKSKTETFATLKLSVNNHRWKGIPFYLRVGKALNQKDVSIKIYFKKINCLLTKACPSETNHFTIRVQPESGFALSLNSKIPEKNFVTPVHMNFCQFDHFGNTPEAYENLLTDVINGDQSTFVRADEIEHAWKIIDKVKRGKVFSYRKGTEGPKQLFAFEKKHKIDMRYLG